MSNGTAGFDTGFVIGVEADGELLENLDTIISEASNYSTAIKNLKEYCTNNELWKGADADAFRARATAPEGPLAKLEKYEAEMVKLSTLANNIKEAINKAQAGLKANIDTAMGGETGGNA